MARPVKNPERSRANVPDSERRDSIRSLAGQVFAEKGYTSATMRDVADAVGILPGSLYHHFASKDEILEELMRTFWEDVLSCCQAVAAAEMEPQASLQALLDRTLAVLLDRRAEATMLLNDIGYMRADTRFEFVDKNAMEAERIWVAELTRGSRTGALREDFDPIIAYRTIMGSLLATLRWYNPTRRLSREQLSAELSRLYLAGLGKPENQPASDGVGQRARPRTR